MCLISAEQRGKVTNLDLLVMLFLMLLRVPLVILAMRVNYWWVVNLLSIMTQRSLSVKLHSSPLAPACTGARDHSSLKAGLWISLHGSSWGFCQASSSACPFLKAGVTFDLLQSSGSSPSHHNLPKDNKDWPCKGMAQLFQHSTHIPWSDSISYSMWLPVPASTSCALPFSVSVFTGCKLNVGLTISRSLDTWHPHSRCFGNNMQCSSFYCAVQLLSNFAKSLHNDRIFCLLLSISETF